MRLVLADTIAIGLQCFRFRTSGSERRENPKLGRWVTVQRVRKKRGTISTEQVAR